MASRPSMSMGREYFSRDSAVFLKVCESEILVPQNRPRVRHCLSRPVILCEWLNRVLPLFSGLRKKALFIELLSRCPQKACKVRK